MEELRYSLIHNAAKIIRELIEEDERTELIINDELMISINKYEDYTEYIVEVYDKDEWPELIGKQVTAYHGLEEDLNEAHENRKFSGCWDKVPRAKGDELKLIGQYSTYDSRTVRLYKNFSLI